MSASEFVEIDKGSGVPIYRQIVLEVTRRVQDGLLESGDALPSEREMADALGIARGTVARAYSELTRNHVIESSVGRGTRISGHQDVVHESRQSRALKAIQEMISTLLDLRFTYREIRTLCDLAVMEREARRRQLCIAAVDCNPEALGIFERQLGFLARVIIRKLLLDDVRRNPERSAQLSAFDLVLTTSTHHEELVRLCPEVRDRILRASVSLSQQTVMDLASLGSGRRIGIICESTAFLAIIMRALAGFSIPPSLIASLRSPDADALAGFVGGRDVLIVPPGYSLLSQPGMGAAAQAFTQRGGRIIPFAYQIERGSLHHIEERIRDLMLRAPEGESEP